ncbi:unnamed protein product, partial [Ectocarpus sp. 12 AP-2014]
APAAELSSTTSRGLTLLATWRTRAGELSYEQPETNNIYMKITGTYRLGVCPEILAGMAQIARESFGIERLLWGSDYPHTVCAAPDIHHREDSQDYMALLQTVRDWCPDEEDQNSVLYSNAAEVFSFPSLKC